MKERLKREIGHQFEILSVLGKGAFATVMECLNLASNEKVALKIIKKYKLTEKQILFSIQESELLRRLDHPNIVKFIGLHHTDSFLILEMELLNGKTLAELLASRNFLAEEESANIMKMIFQAVSYLHKVHVLHRDLKPENIMFQDTHYEKIKITDFGLSTKYTLEERLNTRSGTMAYMAPEQALQKQYSEPIDIWSCGIILYKLLTGSHPLNFTKDDVNAYMKSLQNIQWTFPENFPKLAKDLFLRCTRINPLERYTANLALQHPWIQRTQGHIPLTPLEEVRLYDDKLKLKKLIITYFQIAGTFPCNKFRDDYMKKVIDPNVSEPVKEETDSAPKKKINSLRSLDLGSKEKAFNNARQQSLGYGNLLNVPGHRKNSSASNSPRELGHNNSTIRIISRSPSPNPSTLKSSNKASRFNINFN